MYERQIYRVLFRLRTSLRDDEIGMVWDVPDYLFEKNYAALLDYYREDGNADVPSYYVTADGLELGRWIR